MLRRYFVGKRTGNGEYSDSGGGEHVGSGLADAQFIILFTAAVLGQLSPPADGGRGTVLSGFGGEGRSGSEECSHRTESAAGGAHYEKILRANSRSGGLDFHWDDWADQGDHDIRCQQGGETCYLCCPVRRKCYTIAAEQSAVEVENHEPFGAKWSMFCRLKVRSYVLVANVAGTLKVAPLQILKFPVVLPHKFLDAEKFNLRFSDASEITEIADKLRWYRYQKGLRQRDVADYAGIDRSTYIHYEEAGRDFYPKEHMEKLAELFEVPLEDLLDDYNLFLLRGQGAQIKAIRQRLGLTQKAYAAQLGVPLQKFKRWEQGSVQIFKSTWEKYFKQT